MNEINPSIHALEQDPDRSWNEFCDTYELNRRSRLDFLADALNNHREIKYLTVKPNQDALGELDVFLGEGQREESAIRSEALSKGLWVSEVASVDPIEYLKSLVKEEKLPVVEEFLKSENFGEFKYFTAIQYDFEGGDYVQAMAQDTGNAYQVVRNNRGLENGTKLKKVGTEEAFSLSRDGQQLAIVRQISARELIDYITYEF